MPSGSINMKNRWGNTPLDMAKLFNINAVEILKSNGGKTKEAVNKDSDSECSKDSDSECSEDSHYDNSKDSHYDNSKNSDSVQKIQRLAANKEYVLQYQIAAKNIGMVMVNFAKWYMDNRMSAHL